MARDYRHEYETYQGTEQQKKNRAKRNAARAVMMRKGKVHKGDGKDVDHKTPLAKGGSNNVSNLRVMGKSKNRKRNGH
jgi:5-methylcytosine-specific restriction endonuclease McrA